jgi:hypothetical protein
MNRLAIMFVGLVGLVAFAAARADNLAGSDRFICSTSRASACCDDGECASGSATELNIPQFIEVDMAAKRVSSTKASGNYRSSSVANAKRENGLILLQGMENGRAFSILINEKTGDLSAAVAGTYGCGVTAFGSCTPVPASK